jgi:hypothetical protein
MEDAVLALAELTRTVGAPSGPAVLHPALAADPSVHTSSQTVLESIVKQCQGAGPNEFVNPAWSVIASAIEQHCQLYGAGGWFLASSLVTIWRSLHFGGLPAFSPVRQARTSAELARAARWIGDVAALGHKLPLWQGRVAPAEWPRVAAAQLWRLPLASDEEIASVSRVLTQAIVSVAQRDGLHPQRVHVITEVRPAASRPLLTSSWHPGLVLGFQVPMEAQLVLRSQPDGPPRPRKAVVFTDALRACCHGDALIDAVRNKGLRAVFSQRTIAYELRADLARHGAICIERLSIRNVATVALAIGSTAVGAPAGVGHELPLGDVIIEPIVAAGKHSMRLRHPTNERFATVSLAVANQSVSEETISQACAAVRTLCSLLRRPAVSTLPSIREFLWRYIAARQALSGPCEQLSDAVLVALRDVMCAGTNDTAGASTGTNFIDVNFFNIAALAMPPRSVFGPLEPKTELLAARASSHDVALAGIGGKEPSFGDDAGALLPVDPYISALQWALEQLSALSRVSDIQSFRQQLND